MAIAIRDRHFRPPILVRDFSVRVPDLDYTVQMTRLGISALQSLSSSPDLALAEFPEGGGGGLVGAGFAVIEITPNAQMR